MGKAVILLALLVAGCSSTTGGQFCQVAKEPMRPTPADVEVISDRLVGQILTYNETGAALCGWAP